MWDYLRTPGFQKGFINDAVLKVISMPPPRTAAKDSWEHLIEGKEDRHPSASPDTEEAVRL